MQSEVGECNIVCILQPTGARVHDKVRKHKEELSIVAKTDICIMGKNE